ncbi:hypothetical protein [Rheinheimera aquimaris]|uniref:hypothetical protein n=1 Tax=Rheinheimera aquimaris TaxID=412437 RepID=UPI001065FCCA|nr:hypothetical protein [Rheinheimera aquimaris]
MNLGTSGLVEFRQVAEQRKVWFADRLQTIKRIKDVGSHTVVEILFATVAATDLPNGLKKGEAINFECI